MSTDCIFTNGPWVYVVCSPFIPLPHKIYLVTCFLKRATHRYVELSEKIETASFNDETVRRPALRIHGTQFTKVLMCVTKLLG